MVDWVDRISIIESESARFAEVLADIEPSRRCPTCPDWTGADLLWHLTEVHFFWAEILSRLQTEDNLASIEQAKPQRPGDVSEMLALRAESTSNLLSQLAIRDDTEPCWSWWPPDQTVGFTRRMQTYEATMHRVDAELTAGVPVSPIPSDVAAGAVSHAVDVMWGWMPKAASYRAHSVVEFLATDIGETWLVEVGNWSVPATDDGSTTTGPRARRSTVGEPTATVSAPVEELALWSWTRGGTVQTSGDSRSLAALNAVITEGIQ